MSPKSKPTESASTIVAQVQSDRRENLWYDVTRRPTGALRCPCEAFKWQEKSDRNGDLSCKHIRRTRDALADGGAGRGAVRIPSPYFARRKPEDVFKKASEIKPAEIEKIPTGNVLVDELLGGGFARGNVLLFAGGPGCGKSIFCGMAADQISTAGRTTMYVVGEEPKENYLARLKHYGITPGDACLIGETSFIQDVEAGIERYKPHLVVVDSLQSLKFHKAQSRTPLVEQNIMDRLIKLTRKHQVASVVIGHYTKNGDVRGGLGIQHDVDAVVKIARDQDLPQERIISVEKNRSGPNGVTLRYVLSQTELKLMEDRLNGLGADLARARRRMQKDFEEAEDD